jgi:hypothetical protein
MNTNEVLNKLNAEIERQIKSTENATGDFAEGRRWELENLCNLITSLQQEQPQVADASKMEKVELENEIERYCRIYYNFKYPDQIQNGRCSSVMPHIIEAARHFYKLGFNARGK